MKAKTGFPFKFVINVVTGLPKLEIHLLHPTKNIKENRDTMKEAFTELVAPFANDGLVGGGGQQVLDIMEDIGCPHESLHIEVTLEFQFA